MKKLSAIDYLSLTKDAKIIEADGYGSKVLTLADGTFLKLFRVKRLITSARLKPYSLRFVTNVIKLTALSIPTVAVIKVFNIPTLDRSAVHYHPLPGTTIREQPGQIGGDLAHQLGEFIRGLHDKGVYFRSLHLGNIVLTPEHQLGLIDVSDMKTYKRPLSNTQRLRNFKHLSCYPEDNEKIYHAINNFIDGYQLKSKSTMKMKIFAHLFTQEK